MKKLLVLSLMAMVLVGCGSSAEPQSRNLGKDMQLLEKEGIAYDVTSKKMSQGGTMRLLVTEEGEVSIYNTDGLFVKSVSVTD